MTNREYFLYRHIRLDKNVPFYIGIGTKPKNYFGHRTEFKRAYFTEGRNQHWKSIVKLTDYKVEILYESNDINFIKEKETEFISLYKRKIDGGTLCNLSTGGEGNTGVIVSEELKRKRREIGLRETTYKHFFTEEHKLKTRMSARERSPKVIHIETKKIYESIIDACEELGLDKDVENRKLYRNSPNSKFKYLSPPERRKRSEEVVKKFKEISRSNSKRVIHKETGTEYNSLSDACEILGLSYRVEINKLYYKSKNSKFQYKILSNP